MVAPKTVFPHPSSSIATQDGGGPTPVCVRVMDVRDLVMVATAGAVIVVLKDRSEEVGAVAKR